MLQYFATILPLVESENFNAVKKMFFFGGRNTVRNKIEYIAHSQFSLIMYMSIKKF